MSIRKTALIGLILLASLSACTQPKAENYDNNTSPAPTNGASANQEAWNQGRVPPEMNPDQAKERPPVSATQSTTGTTAATGEIESAPTSNQPTSQ